MFLLVLHTRYGARSIGEPIPADRTADTIVKDWREAFTRYVNTNYPPQVFRPHRAEGQKDKRDEKSPFAVAQALQLQMAVHCSAQLLRTLLDAERPGDHDRPRGWPATKEAWTQYFYQPILALTLAVAMSDSMKNACPVLEEFRSQWDLHLGHAFDVEKVVEKADSTGGFRFLPL